MGIRIRPSKCVLGGDVQVMKPEELRDKLLCS